MRTARDVVVALFLIAILTRHVAASQSSEEDEEETFETDLKEAGLTIAGAKGSLSISPANLAPSGNNMDPSGEDDLLFSSDYGLSRYRRAAGNNSEDVGSGYARPCDTNSTLCNDTGQECVNDPDNANRYQCRCKDGFEEINDVCVEVRSVAFGIEVKISIDNLNTILANKTSMAYQRLEDDVKSVLFIELNKTVVGLLDVVIVSMSVGSLVVDAEAKLNKMLEADVVSSVAKAVVGLKSKQLNISGQTGTVGGVFVNKKPVSNACDVFEATTPCSQDAECRLDNGFPFCRPFPRDDYDLVIGLGAGIPVFFIVMLVIACLVYFGIRRRRRRKSRWPKVDDQLFGVRGRKIATRGSLGNPVRGMYLPDSLSSTSDDDDKHRGKLRGSHGDTHWTSSFTWDLLYKQHRPDEQPFSFKRPKFDSSPDPIYNTAWADDGDSVL